MEVYLFIFILPFPFFLINLLPSLVISTPIAVSSFSSSSCTSPLFPLLHPYLHLYLNLSFDVMLTSALLTLPMIYQQH